MKNYVFPTVDDLNDGCGVLVGNLFVTAAHVVQEHDFRLWVDGKEVRLKKDDSILFKYKQAEDGADIAVFRLEGFNSPLEFDTSTPQTDMLLDSISYEHIVEGSPNTDNIFLDESRDCYKLIECNATIEELAGNFYQCKTSVILKPGSSGSPVFHNGKVFGILHGGQLGTNHCVFQSSSSILTLLRQAETLK
ncbi:MAG: trypsin-like peptidase domain-containing protein [Prevotella sp.]|nr:trypsin-like peptidase domain-containing protein [Bacteroidales bacterium]MBP3777307.1 trypsin-like peptidase domain-containing protein [Prevotella sp.]